jgi:hypothetical protein
VHRACILYILPASSASVCFSFQAPFRCSSPGAQGAAQRPPIPAIQVTTAAFGTIQHISRCFITVMATSCTGQIPHN